MGLKKIKGIIIILLLLLTLLYLLYIVLLKPTDNEAREKANYNYSIKDILIDENFDIFNENMVFVKEGSLNVIAAPQVTKTLNEITNSSLIRFTSSYISLDDSIMEMRFNLNLSILPLEVRLQTLPVIANNRLAIEIKKLYLGKIPLSSKFINLFGLRTKNNIYYFNSNLVPLNGLLITSIVVYDSQLMISYRTENDILIDSYILPKYRKPIKEMLLILNRDKKGPLFATSLIKGLMLQNIDGDIPDYIMSEIKNNFSHLDKSTKGNLIFMLLKYGFLEILELLGN